MIDNKLNKFCKKMKKMQEEIARHNENLLKVCEFLLENRYARSFSEIAKNSKVNRNYIKDLQNSKSQYSDIFLENLCNAYPVNKKYILTGEGEMLKTTEKKQPQQASKEEVTMVKLFPVTAMGGSFNDFVVSLKDTDECEMIVSPVKNVDGALTVSGDSMSPEYPNGSRIFVKRIDEKAFIEWGKVYVLDTCNGAVIKQVVQSDKEGYVRCISLNPNPIYQPFDVRYEDIYHWFKVIVCLSLK